MGKLTFGFEYEIIFDIFSFNDKKKTSGQLYAILSFIIPENHLVISLFCISDRNMAQCCT